MTKPLTSSQSAALDKITRVIADRFLGYLHVSQNTERSPDQWWFNFHIALSRSLRRAQAIDPNMRVTDLLSPNELAQVYAGAFRYFLTIKADFRDTIRDNEEREKILAGSLAQLRDAIATMDYDTERITVKYPINSDSCLLLQFKPATAGIHTAFRALPKPHLRTQEEVCNVLLRLGGRRVSDPTMAPAVAFEFDGLSESNHNIKGEPPRLRTYAYPEGWVTLCLRGKRADGLTLEAVINSILGEQIEELLPQMRETANSLWLIFSAQTKRP